MSSREDGTTEDLHITVHHIDTALQHLAWSSHCCINYNDDGLCCCSDDDDDLVIMGKMAARPIHEATLEW